MGDYFVKNRKLSFVGTTILLSTTSRVQKKTQHLRDLSPSYNARIGKMYTITNFKLIIIHF